MPVKPSVLKQTRSKGGKGKLEKIEPSIDPDVLATLDESIGSREPNPSKYAQKTPAQLKKIRADRKRNRETFDCSSDLSLAIDEIIERYREKRDTRKPFPRSGLIEYLVILGLERFLEIGGGVRRYTEATYSPHYVRKIAPPPVPDVSGFDDSADE